MTALRTRITCSPIAFDAARGAAVLAPLDASLRDGALGELLQGTAGSSPYLARLLTRHATWITPVVDQPPEEVIAGLCTDLAAFPDDGSVADLRSTLRVAKSRAALLIALADLGGVWSFPQVTDALTRLADRSVETAARWLLAQEIRQNRLPGMGSGALETGAAYTIIAMGKMGAHELNYSSDIDLIALFDDSQFADDDVLDARARYIHVTRQLVKLLSENTGEGYVFRTDLRLRPAPSTTPVCMSMDAAERYYESIGRTWERAAHIKARALVDVTAGSAYLDRLVPFIWRRNLDFAAIEDTHGMLQKIRAQKTHFGAAALPGRDLKLGPGGIREIEFFAQTRQLIMGGRDPSLRAPTTLGALDALVSAGQIGAEIRDTLAQDYVMLRVFEHRVQMTEDIQTHAVPKSDEGRARFAALCGRDDLGTFEGELAALLQRVHATVEGFFAKTERPARQTEHSEDELGELGFERPGDAARQIARWHHGEIAATRGERARALFAGLEEQIVHRLGGAASPDQALAHFDRFLSGLPSGVQVFSLFAANPDLLDLIIGTCAAAPRLAAYLGRQPQTLDALVDRQFWEPIPARAELDAALAAQLAPLDDYEHVLDAVRRWAREMKFRAGIQVLRGVSDAAEAGAAFTRIAETCLEALYPHVIANFARRHGAPPGDGMVVMAMGKLGSAEMTSGSDLDLIIVYSDAGVEMSDGPRPLPPRSYYPRLTQAYVAALSAPTAEGVLFEVDMRLRPSGRMGPVAVSLAAFENYQMNEAWVWEHMALTRARAILGPDDLAQKVGAITARAIAGRKGREVVTQEAAEMRARLVEAHKGDRDKPWALKYAAGGLMEVEFLAQVGSLLHGVTGCRTAEQALHGLAGTPWLTDEDAQDLGATVSLLQLLQQIERVAIDGELSAQGMGAELREALVRGAGEEDFEALETRLTVGQARAAEIIARIFGDASTEP